MGRSKQTSMKKEKENKKRQKRLKKEEKRVARAANSNKGKGFDSMIAYVDEFGQFSDTPPDLTKRKDLDLEDISLGGKRQERDTAGDKSEGKISYFNEEKGYGFIRDSKTRESVFFHLNSAKQPLRLNDSVVFEKVRGPKGMNATAVIKAD
jgi:cold shock CspA family protein